MRKKAIILISMAMITLFGGVTVKENYKYKVIGSVGSIPIYEREVLRECEQNRAIVAQNFMEKYHVQMDEDFWENQYDGISPAEELRTSSLQNVIDDKCQQLLALEVGIDTCIDYRDFLKIYGKEKNDRKMKVSKGEAVYGPVSFNEADYWEYYMSNLKIEIINKMVEDGEPDSTEDVNSRYEEAIRQIKQKYTG
ncbi:MAG: hypothetical protein K6G30_01355 [Acetatifactor sp.]|jgi:hypothetical protein|nr:hypothetical protein [Acetatifactor sp.]